MQHGIAGKNSIDTDKFDYLARDTYFMGMKSTFDFRRLMVQNKVIHGNSMQLALSGSAADVSPLVQVKSASTARKCTQSRNSSTLGIRFSRTATCIAQARLWST